MSQELEGVRMTGDFSKRGKQKLTKERGFVIIVRSVAAW